MERQSKPEGSAGLTLIEVAIVLVILGLLMGLGAGLISMLTKRSKIVESRETVDAAVEALVSYAAGNKCLTDNLTQANVRKILDAWNQPLFLRVAPELLPGQCSPYNSTICDRKSTNLTVKICSDAACTSYQEIKNVAFVVASNGPNYIRQIMNETSEVKIYTPGLQVNSLEFDDIVKWVTLDELRTKMGCPGAQLRIITTELPLAYQNQPYSAIIYAEGGVKPLNWSFNSTASWLSCSSGSDSTAYNCIGTPSCPGSYTLTVYVEDNSSIPPKSNATRSYTINVQPDQLRLTPVPGTTWYAFNGSSFTATIIATGGKQTYNFTCTPSACSGLTCTCSSTGCTIGGTANISSNSSVTCPFTITASDSCPGTSQQTASGTYYVVINPTYSGGSGGDGRDGGNGGGSGGGSPPTCTLSVSPAPDSLGIIILSYNSLLTLSWTISNGPASYTFNPQSGNCTSGSNSIKGNCQTDPYTRNVSNATSQPLNYTLYVANAYGSGSCTTNITKICVENSARTYRVWNLTRARKDFRLPDGTCRRVNKNEEITTATSQLRPGTQIIAYSSSDGTCSGTPLETFSYNTAVCLDDDGNGLVNMTGNENGTDRKKF